jgi:pSer/pThr/pTyr-binding forkhead associated (FHA) protein
VITLSLLHPLHKTPVQSWSFDQVPVVRVGRSTDNHVVLYSAVVSRHHVELHRMEQGWALKSLGTNGTYVDNKRISEMPVKDGMIIRLARSGPNIQIHTTEEKRDPLQELLSNRRKTAIDMDEGETRSARESVSTELPNQTTVIP